MCWSESATLAMVGLGAAATLVSARNGSPRAVPVTLGYFTVMEALQAGGYMVIDQCDLVPNRVVTALSFFHITLQPIIINLFLLALVGPHVTRRMRRGVLVAAGVASVIVALRLVPFDWAGPCRDGMSLCGPGWCTVTGTWHLGWTMPLNDMWTAIWGEWMQGHLPFPAYFAAVFGLPVLYGAWRFALFHLVLGPVLAMLLTDDPNEMPAIWCLFSVGLVLTALVPPVRRAMFPRAVAA
ncbi:DUF5765 domain-containing protein [Maritimibacter fusiformis]|uniref:Uncharacterized protein n=1 Tax=Maritimibacter fusiformis TaxID=2603819 RepID=A0A5D0RNH1_9RHOB|nr:DUF5765 domain-containing protein [Maritimibacter fusiformis]TYB83033.1 hypothetical protein FVF75_02285 [Maritimibacter fusiformis]